ncbi:MAG: DMT family transporter [Proteobacteria bacterium]|nr:DMT family transporter [Pseudomonadota bacterium]
MSGIAYALLAAFTFSVMNALVKALSGAVPAAEIIFYRGVIGVAITLAVMLRSGSSFRCANVPVMVLRSGLGAAALALMILSLGKIKLADASMLAHLSPVFVVVLAQGALGEAPPRRFAGLLAIGLLGAALIVKPAGHGLYSVYALMALVSAIFSAGAVVAIRRLARDHDPHLIILSFLATASALSAPFMAGRYVAPDARQWVLLGAVGVVSFFGQTFLTYALAREKAAVVDTTRFSGIAFNALWGLLFWSERLDALSIAGGVLIVAACVLLQRVKAPRPAPGALAAAAP